MPSTTARPGASLAGSRGTTSIPASPPRSAGTSTIALGARRCRPTGTAESAWAWEPAREDHSDQDPRRRGAQAAGPARRAGLLPGDLPPRQVRGAGSPRQVRAGQPLVLGGARHLARHACAARAPPGQAGAGGVRQGLRRRRRPAAGLADLRHLGGRGAVRGEFSPALRAARLRSRLPGAERHVPRRVQVHHPLQPARRDRARLERPRGRDRLAVRHAVAQQARRPLAAPRRAAAAARTLPRPDGTGGHPTRHRGRRQYRRLAGRGRGSRAQTMTERRVFGDRDLQQMERLGIAPEEALRHVELFRNPPPYTRVLRPCTLGDGIRAIAAEDEPELTARFDEAAAAGRIHKFVPASGAASRMFQPLLEHLEELEGAGGPAAAGRHGSREGSAPPPSAEVRTFFDELPRFAFFEELAAAAAARGVRLPFPAEAGSSGLPAADRRTVLSCLLTAEGLGYAELPKGLILFHRHPDGPRTPFEEHLVEAADYARDRDGVCRLHFTVSPRHEAGFGSLLAARGAALGRRLGCRFEVGFSHQRRSTHTLAVDPELRPFRQADGSLLFRPGGHGALLDNLQQLADGGAGVVLLKNIDNVVPDRLKPELTRWKKLLGDRK